MKISHSLIILLMFMAHEAKACEIQGSILICKEGTPESHDCTREKENTVVLAFKNKYTCSAKTSQTQNTGSRFKIAHHSTEWIPENIEMTFPPSQWLESKKCEIKTNSQLECSNIKAYKCSTAKNTRIFRHLDQKYTCSEAKFTVDGEKIYKWKLTDSPDSSRSTSPNSAVNLEESLDKLEAAILEVRNALQSRKTAR